MNAYEWNFLNTNNKMRQSLKMKFCLLIEMVLKSFDRLIGKMESRGEKRFIYIFIQNVF